MLNIKNIGTAIEPIKQGEPLVWFDDTSGEVHISPKIKPYPGAKKRVLRTLKKMYRRDDLYFA